MRHGRVIYPGITDSVSGSYTLTQGTAPSEVVITCAPTAVQNLAVEGDCYITDGVGTVPLPGCRYNRHVYHASAGGAQTLTIYLFDRRWRWRSAVISGRYNIPAETYFPVPPLPPPGAASTPNQFQAPTEYVPPFREETLRSARQLGRLLADALGEKNADVSILPDDQYPQVDWSVSPAAAELSALAESFGCRPVWNPFDNRLRIVKQGQGGPLPEASLLVDESPSIDPPETPSKIVIWSAPVETQMRFRLEPVGLDFDGNVKPVYDLSYRPDDTDLDPSGLTIQVGPTFNLGWPYSSPPAFLVTRESRLPGAYLKRDAVALAEQSLYRWFRIVPYSADIPPDYFNDGELDTAAYPLRVPPDDTTDKSIKTISQVFLENYSLVVVPDEFSGRSVQLPAKIYGRHVIGYGNTVHHWDDPEIATEYPFGIDQERRLVQFGNYIYDGDPTTRTVAGTTITSVSTPRFPRLTLECACKVLDNDTLQFRRKSWEFTLGGTAPPVHVVREDIRYREVASYQADNVLEKVWTNEPHCKKLAEGYARGEMARYQIKGGLDRTYGGIEPVAVDGYVVQVSWSWGRFATTRASASTEHDVFIPTYDARRRLEQTAADYLRRQGQTAAQLKRETGGEA